jgi:Flp pilus assembly protein CpaB
MTNKKNLMTLLGIAFVVAIIATGLFYGLVVTKLNSAAAISRDTVVVALHDLEPGHVLAPDDVELAPRSSVDGLVDGFHEQAQVAGLVVMRSIMKGEPVDRSSLASKNSSRGAALGIPPGMRAVSIHVADSTGVVRLLQPGHRVDAQIVSATGRRGTMMLRTVLQDLEVLRVEEDPESSEGRPVLPVVTVVASPAEADVLGVADAVARVRLLLRHPLDDELTARGSVALRTVVENPPVQEQRGARVSAMSSPEPKEEPDDDAVTTAAQVAGVR